MSGFGSGQTVRQRVSLETMPAPNLPVGLRVLGERHRVSPVKAPAVDDVVNHANVQVEDDGGLGLGPVHGLDGPEDVAGFLKVTFSFQGLSPLIKGEKTSSLEIRIPVCDSFKDTGAARF